MEDRGIRQETYMVEGEKPTPSRCPLASTPSPVHTKKQIKVFLKKKYKDKMCGPQRKKNQQAVLPGPEKVEPTIGQMFL